MKAWLLRLGVKAGVLCPHVLSPTSREWRPAKKSVRADWTSWREVHFIGRTCGLCDAFESLTREEFYAHFGLEADAFMAPLRRHA